MISGGIEVSSLKISKQIWQPYLRNMKKNIFWPSFSSNPFFPPNTVKKCRTKIFSSLPCRISNIMLWRPPKMLTRPLDLIFLLAEKTWTGSLHIYLYIGEAVDPLCSLNFELTQNIFCRTLCPPASRDFLKGVEFYVNEWEIEKTSKAII